MILMLPTLFERFKRLPTRFYDKGQVVRTKNIKKYKLCKVIGNSLDPFGTYRIRINGIEGNLLNDTGEAFHSLDRRKFSDNTFPIFTACIIRSDFIIEVADFVYWPYRGLALVNYKLGEIPKELRPLGIDIYRNNWSFFFYDRYVSLRFILGDKEDSWDAKYSKYLKLVPKKYQHVDSREWLCKPRIKIWVKKCETLKLEQKLIL